VLEEAMRNSDETPGERRGVSPTCPRRDISHVGLTPRRAPAESRPNPALQGHLRDAFDGQQLTPRFAGRSSRERPQLAALEQCLLFEDGVGARSIFPRNL